MNHKSARPAEEMEQIMNTYGNMLFRLCLLTLGNTGDAEDAIQETLIKYMQKAPMFHDEEHRKAWLIKVAANQCRDMLRYKKRHPVVNKEEIHGFTKEEKDSDILDALETLPDKYKTVLLLYYVEEYSMESIAKIIGRTTSAVKMR